MRLSNSLLAIVLLAPMAAAQSGRLPDGQPNIQGMYTRSGVKGLEAEPPFTILFDPDTEVVKDMFGTTLYPETWLIDGNGVIRARIDGPRDWSNPMALEVVEMIGRPAGCPVSFVRGKPAGPDAKLCGDELL